MSCPPIKRAIVNLNNYELEGDHLQVNMDFSHVSIGMEEFTGNIKSHNCLKCYTLHRAHCILKVSLIEGNYDHNIWHWFIDIHNKYRLAVGCGDRSTVSNILQ